VLNRDCVSRSSHRFELPEIFDIEIVMRKLLNYWRNYWFTALPLLAAPDRVLLKQLRRQGVVETHLDQLQLANTAPMWAAAHALVPSLPNPSPAAVTHVAGRKVQDFEAHCVHADAAKFVLDYPEILLWGLGDRLLDLVENLMGCPPALIGVALRKDRPNGQQIGTRLWHMDGEDKHVFKILIYLNDVSQAEGPFEYVPKQRFNPKYRGFSRFLVRFRRGYNQNQGFEKIVKPKHWKSATGKAGTAILTDTAKVFHHGAIATEGERLVLIFAYTTQQPRALELCKQFFPRADLLPLLLPHLNPRQAASLLGWRRHIQDVDDPVKEATQRHRSIPFRSGKMKSRF
jgi:hypothetical protein